MFAPTRLTVEGFRGFRGAEEFELNQTVTELFGDNGCGKSCTLNAIEWALFGDGCSGKQTGIRERVDWAVANRHVSAPAVRVQLDMEVPDGTYVIIRTLRRPLRKTALKEDLELTLPDATKLSGDEAYKKLEGLLRSTFRDFLTTVYQHQEAIRAVLTQEPKDRNDAIDRLLGLSDKANLLSALKGADLASRQKDIARNFAAFEEKVKATIEFRATEIARLRQEAQEAGLAANQLNGKAALAAAKRITTTVQAYAKEAALDSVELPVGDAWPELVDFEKTSVALISRMRGLVPGIQEQQQLLPRRQQLLELKTALERIQQGWSDLGRKTRTLDPEHSGWQALDAKIEAANHRLRGEKELLRQADGRAAVLDEAIRFLTGAGNEGAPCPVCETPVPGLVEKLNDMAAKTLQPLVQNSKNNILAIEKEIRELQGVANQYKQLNEDGEALKQRQISKQKEAATLLKKALAEDDNPLNLVSAELDRIDGRLQELSSAIQQRQERLDKIAADVDRVSLVRKYLQEEAKKQFLEKIEQSDAFKRLESIRDQVAELVEDSDALKSAVADAAREEAETKLVSAQQAIAEYFNHLSSNPAVGELKLDVDSDKRTGRNSYAITDQDGKDLTPILSQGDLNALALAIFLGLASAAKASSVFQFLMLDDPSQSLDSEHKRQLALLLNRVALHKRLIVATMDAEFHGYLTACLTKATRLYRFEKWSPDEGPFIRR
jgi:DNA repair protein SbcC/Rad50